MIADVQNLSMCIGCVEHFDAPLIEAHYTVRDCKDLLSHPKTTAASEWIEAAVIRVVLGGITGDSAAAASVPASALPIPGSAAARRKEHSERA